jgi:hypothetical protein
MHNDQMIVGLDSIRTLWPTAPEPRPLMAIERTSESVSYICRSGVPNTSTLRRSRRRIYCFSVSIFSFRRLFLVCSAFDGSWRSAVSSCSR